MPPGSSEQRRDSGRALRVLALIAVGVGVAVVTAAACTLSYNSIHILASQAGVTAPLAKIYPYVFDATLVLAGCSVLALRGAGLPSRIYGWLCFIVLLAALAGGGAAHAAHLRVPHRSAAVIGAIVPFALVLIAFGLLVALLRYARLRRIRERAASRAGPDPVDAGPGPSRRPVALPAELQLRARMPRASPDGAGAAAASAVGEPADASSQRDPEQAATAESPAFERQHSSPTPPDA